MSTSSFRGADETEVKVLLMPSQYENMQKAKHVESYRLVYSETNLGSQSTYRGATNFYGGNTATGAAAKPANYFTWVKEDSFVDSSTANAVKFVLNMPLATSRVSIGEVLHVCSRAQRHRPTQQPPHSHHHHCATGPRAGRARARARACA